MKTYSAKAEAIEHNWLIVDATGKTLGRLASQIAHILRGKHKPEFTPHVDCGDFVIVVNSQHIKVTGKKLSDKKYHRHTGYPGGLKTTILSDMLKRKPNAVIETAVRGMLPKNPLGRAMFRKLKVYDTADHPHAAQQPTSIFTEESE